MKRKKKSNKVKNTEDRTITRKEAIKKTGYIALSATTMMLLLSKPDKAVAQSMAPPGAWPG